MLPKLSRDQVQIVSIFLFMVGIAVLVSGAWSNELFRSIGISMMAGSIWFVMISESILLGKVQNEMHLVLEKLSAKREREIEELLYFLREAKLRRDPWSSIEAASAYIDKLPYPAYVITPEMRIYKFNKAWTDSLGWDKSAYGKSAISLQCPDCWGELSVKLANSSDKKEWMHFSKYCYVSSSGEKVDGTAAIFIFPDLSGVAAIFYPDKDGIIPR